MIMRNKKCTSLKKDQVKESDESKTLRSSKLPKSSAKASTFDSDSSDDETFIPDDISDISYESLSKSDIPKPCCKRFVSICCYKK